MMTVKQVAEILKVSEAYIRKICGEKRLNCIKFGRDWTITESERDLLRQGKSIIKKRTSKHRKKSWQR